MPTNLDRTSLRLVDMLQQDARMSVSDIARRMNRADSTVRERIISLERQGIVRGYRALVDPSSIGFKTQAIIRAEAEYADLAEIAKALATVPNVTHATVTTGAKPICIRVTTEDFSTLERFLEKRIAPLPLRSLETKVVVSTLVEERPLQLAALPTNGLTDQFLANFEPKRAQPAAPLMEIRH